MSSPTTRPRIKAHLALTHPSAGGRTAGLMNGYMPHLVVAGHRDFLGVRVVDLASPLAAGAAGDVVLELLYYPAVDYSVLTPGARFTMQEGPNVIASGEVVSGP